MRYVKRSDKFSFIEKYKVTIGKNMWGKIVCAVQIISFRRCHIPCTMKE